MNVVVEYLYRDAGNNKIWNDVVFLNRMSVDVDVLESHIKEALIDGEFFVAEDVELPLLYFENNDDEIDHGWHEYYSIKETEDSPSDELRRDIYDFVSMLNLSKLAIDNMQ